MSDSFWANFPATLLALGTFVGVIVTAWLQVKAAGKTEAVRTDLAASTKASSDQMKVVSTALIETKQIVGETKVLGEQTHILVNERMAIQLRLSARSARRTADLTKDPEDERLALEAEKLLREHMAQQQLVDAGKN